MAADISVNDQRQFVLLRRCRDLSDAFILKSILDSAGIECCLSDENMVRMDWFWSNLLGCAKLWVRQQDLEQAQALIRQDSPEIFDVQGIGEFRQPHCPNCHSVDISFRELNKRVAFITAYLGIPIPLKRRGWQCHSCGHSWKELND